jgi:glycosyltransferase involved in cell wall biosynthesis
MKLLQIGSSWLSYKFSGLERYYTDLVTALPALGPEVTGIAYELNDPPSIDGLKLVSFGTLEKSYWRMFRDQRHILKEYLNKDFDLIVSHCTPSMFPSLSQLNDTPLVCHFHGPRYLERRVEGAHFLSVALSRFIENRVYARTRHAITLSNYMKTVLVENYGFPEQNVSVVPGGVNTAHFRQQVSRQDARLQLNLPVDRPVILSVRRLESRMGLNNLIEAMASIVRRYPEALLLIVGKGTLKDALQAQIESLNLGSNVRLMGAVSDQSLPVLYRAADFSVVPSTNYEGFGLVLTESLAAGTPVLGTPTGAIAEVLAPLSQALLLEGATARHIDEVISEVLAGKRVLPGLSECENYAEENFSWGSISRKVLNVYENVLRNRG